MFGLFGDKDNPASALWHRDGTSVRFKKELVPLIERFGLAVKARAFEKGDVSVYPPLEADVDGAFVGLSIEEKDGTWMLEVSVEIEGNLPDGLAVRRRRGLDAAVFDEVVPSDPDLARAALIEAMSGPLAKPWVRRNEAVLARLIDLDGELHEGWLLRSRPAGSKDEAAWIEQSVEGLLSIATDLR